MRVLLVDVAPALTSLVRARLGGQATVDVSDGDLLDPGANVGRDHDVVVHALGEGVDDQDRLLRSTLGTWNLLRPRTGGRYVQLSSMRQFERYDEGWAITEEWLPRPATDATALAHHLGELASHELTRSRAVTTLVLRLDEVVSAERFAAGPVEPRWLHIEDAADAVVAAIRAEVPAPTVGGRWTPLHVVRGDGRYRLRRLAAAPFGFTPAHRHQTTGAVPVPGIPTVPSISGLTAPNRITLYGAGGPLGAATLAELADRDHVRATDVRTLAELATRPPQSEVAPVPKPLPAPHEDLAVDVTDYEQVRAAAVDADCLVNTTVIREDIALAFRVNLLGAWHTMRAAVAEGAGRVVHTGPTLAIAPYPLGNRDDRRVDGSQSLRSGDWIYLLTKLLGQEVCRLFAEEQTLACPILLFNGFTGTTPTTGGNQPTSFSVSWDDSGRAMRAAVDVPALPEPAPVINIVAPQPHDMWSIDRARDILGWTASDPLDAFWYDPRVRQV